MTRTPTGIYQAPRSGRNCLKKGILRRIALLPGSAVKYNSPTAAVGLLYFTAEPGSNAMRLNMPFFKQLRPDLGAWYIPVGVLVIVGTSNAVNLTDGLDGLATGPYIIAAFVYAGIAYVVGNANFAEYLNLMHIRGAGELAVFCGALLGASLGFLWFNAYPAQVFMGDVGALALGSALGTVAVLAKHELL